MADGTQYLIDIAAKMAGGDATSAKLEEIADRLTGTGASVATFEAAIARAETALAQTGAASTAANASLQEAEQRYAQMERAADKAAKAVERAAAKGGKQANMHVLARDAHVAAQALVEEAAALDKAKASAAGAAAAHSKAAAAMKGLQAGAKQAKAAMPTGKINELGDGLSKIGGPLGNAGTKVKDLSEGWTQLKTTLGGTGAKLAVAGAAVAVVVVAVVALTAAVIAGTVALGAWGVKLADAGRTSALTTAALAANNASLANLGKIMPGVSRATGVSTDALRGLAKQLADAKVSAEEMPAALKAAATAEAALGQGGASEFIAQLKEGKKTVADFANEANSKFGGIVQKRLLGLDKQAETFKKNLAETFGGLNIDPLLTALSKLVDMFSQSTAFGQTLKFLFEGLFQPIINGVTKAMPVVEAFLLGMAIGALKVYIAFKPAIKAAGELLGFEDSTLSGALDAAKTAGVVFAVVAIAAIVAVVAGIGLLIAAAALIAAPFVMMGAMVIAPFVAIGAAIYGLGSLVVYLVGLGGQMIAGLAKGISGAAQAVITAITGVVTGGIDAAKSLLGIASPSKVFAGIGGNVGEGFVGGVEDVDTRGPLERMVEPPKAKKGASAGGGGRGGVDLSHSTFTFNGVKDAEDALAMFESFFTRTIEGDLTQLGGDLEPEPEPA